MEFIMQFFDTLLFQILLPCAHFLGAGLELLTLRPMSALGLGLKTQTVVMGMLVGLLSLLIKRLLASEEVERTFQREFAEAKKEQSMLCHIPDWKSRQLYTKVLDDELDYEFNSYLAGRFSRYGLSYLLPIFISQCWLEGALYHHGVASPLSRIFFIGYLGTILLHFVGKRWGKFEHSFTILRRHKL